MHPCLWFVLTYKQTRQDMKRLLIAGFIGCTTITAQAQTTNSKQLDINNVKALITANGPLFYDGNEHVYEVPKGSNKSTVFASSLWIGGISNNNLYLTAETYKQQGTDLQAGPVLNNYSQTTNQYWNRVWSIKKIDIQNFLFNIQNNLSVNTPQFFDILEWPAKGNVKVGDTTQGYAPFVDANSNGKYEPLLGDYPKIKGDMMLYSVMNDDLPTHTESGGAPMKIEIHRSSYAYQTNNHLNNSIFVDYKIINKSNRQYDSLLFSSWVDYDLGHYSDDYIGSDVSRNMIYAYNGDSNDEGILGYGLTPPAQACVVLSHDLYSSRFYHNDFSIVGNPTRPEHYYYYMNGRNKVNGEIIKNGNPMKFHFDGNPCTQTGWTERNDTLAPGDRRILGTIPPQFLAPEAELNVTMAFVYARPSSGDHLSSVCALQTAVDEVSAWHKNHSTGIKEKTTYNNDVNIYPNPTTGMLNIDVKQHNFTSITIMDLTGKEVLNTSSTTIDVSMLDAGIYYIQLSDKDGLMHTQKFVKQ
jgi:hypothetical protein